MYRAIIPLTFLLAAACGGSGAPTTPSSAEAGAPGLQGQTVDAITGAASGNTTVALGGYRAVNSDATGNFSIDGGQPGTYTAIVKGGGIVERNTTVNASGSQLRLSVIPSTFDMAAFNEMFRGTNGRLQRWTSRPALVIVATTMSFRSTSDDQFQTLAEQMTSDEVSQLVSHLNEGLAVLTGNTFTSFASVEIERPPAGDRVTTVRTGKVVVGRFAGISTLASTIGYGRWAEQSDGTIAGGSVYLDRDFDYSDGRRRLLRIHELGHALGYQHVESRPSIMNPTVGADVTDFDRAGAVIAFKRPPGNRAPDSDPSGVRLSVESEGGIRWSSPILCR